MLFANKVLFLWGNNNYRQMKRTILSIITMLSMTCAFAQSALNGSYFNKDLYIRIHLNVDKADIPVPGLELDSCYGYIQGNINSSWIILKVKKNEGNKAIVRAMCEKGDNAQDLELTINETELSIKQIGDSYIKGIKDRKYVKLPKTIILNKE